MRVCVRVRECSACAVVSICAVLMQAVINGAVTSVQLRVLSLSF